MGTKKQKERTDIWPSGVVTVFTEAGFRKEDEQHPEKWVFQESKRSEYQKLKDFFLLKKLDKKQKVFDPKVFLEDITKDDLGDSLRLNTDYCCIYNC